MSFWNLFGIDYRKNCLAWKHSPNNPVLPAYGSTWKGFWTANPDILEYGGKTLLYYRGNGIIPGTDNTRHDRIGVCEILDISSDTIDVRYLAEELPIVDVGEKGAFDSMYVLDPAAVVFQEKVWLYYSALGDGPDSVGLAVSDDGIHFEKVGKILEGRVPEVVFKDNRIFILYQKKDSLGKYEFFIAQSEDGIKFKNLQESAIFSPTGGIGWDSYDVSTGRLYREGDWYLLIYGGGSSLVDQPDYFGLARSKDLIHWERHPGNPIFGCGPKGSEDGGAIWFPALIETADYFILLYEGSRGDYQGDLSSQICMASILKRSQ
jgi:predicted GH43/DUF377 family glycosyl hydrolase